MYPLKVQLAEGVGFAVANTEAEHKSLTDAGYVPAFVVVSPEIVREMSGVSPEPAAVVRKPGRPKKVSDAGA